MFGLIKNLQTFTSEVSCDAPNDAAENVSTLESGKITQKSSCRVSDVADAANGNTFCHVSSMSHGDVAAAPRTVAFHDVF